ncbi:tail fiber domain-containing protein [Niameybacter massiliensis]|uniref:tail fiber domain-containing protein n=1 Tax=Niameybacter massiliensis TaxID=1658108 RepID=UPI0006B5C287|nr:tail fiber domain-containing protein [Niameybacter massiliensis]
MIRELSKNILPNVPEPLTVTGSYTQTQSLTDLFKTESYTLSFDAQDIQGDKNYFLMYLTYDDGTVHTYFLPIQFLGEQSITFDVEFPVSTIQFYIYGSCTLSQLKLQSVITDPLTDEQKESIDKVTTNSAYWDRILAITNSLGNVITSKLEGTINTSLNMITDSKGQMYWEDGNFICRDGETDATSTMAMKFSPAGFMIASGKNVNGTWKWRTFGTGKGFVADEIISGTLSAIAIQGVTITASTLTGGTINGVTINGSTIYAGDKKAGNYIEVSPNNPVKVWQNGKVVSSLGYSAIGGGNITVYDKHGAKAFSIECLEDGDLEVFGNSDNALIPDPNHDGYYIPNPNARKVIFKAGKVQFDSQVYAPSLYGMSGAGENTPYLTEDRFNAILTTKLLTNEIVSGTYLRQTLTNYADKSHTHTGYAASTHSHYNYAESNHKHTDYASSSHTHSGYASSTHSHSEYASSGHTHTVNSDGSHSHSFTSNSWGGSVGTAGSHTHTLSNYSDIRLKEHVERLDDEKIFEFLKTLDIVSYNFKDKNIDQRTLVGVIAQQLRESEFGKLFTIQDEEGYYGVFYQFLATSAIGAIRVLDKKNKELEQRLEKLELLIKE